MKKILFFLVGMLFFLQQGYSQAKDTTFFEDFDVSPPNGWRANWAQNPFWGADRTVSKPNQLGVDNQQSYLGRVPTRVGDSCEFVSPVYDLTNGYSNAYLRFWHICKISPLDTARVQYRIGLGGGVFSAWKPLPTGSNYLGGAPTYKTLSRFNAASYSKWDAGNIQALPDNGWWQKEEWDLSFEAGNSEVQFRFFIKHGTQAGTQQSYGWLIENFELIAANHVIKPPIVQFVSPFVRDTVHNTGPWVINAKVKSSISGVGVVPPYLKWSTNGGITYDSVLMTKISGDTLWRASIPQKPAGTTVIYAITGIDLVGNKATDVSQYYIKLSCGGVGSVMNLGYTGSVEPILLSPGIYEVETWGANGGDVSNTAQGGKGGYSTGTLTLYSTTMVYVYVGGAGVRKPANNQIALGGYNGGGNSPANTSSNFYGSSGGGATHIATANGLLSTLSNNQSAVKIVAGGGGGAGNDNCGTPYGGGYGGGNVGGDGFASGYNDRFGRGGTQSAGGAPGTSGNPNGGAGTFGQGGNGASYNSSGGGAGGGWYGGAGGSGGNDCAGAAGGGSGWIGGVTNGITVQSGQPGFVPNPDILGNGHAKITMIAGGLEPHPGYDLALTSVVSPNNDSDLCAASDVHVKVTLQNMGENDYDFSRDNVTLFYKITPPKQAMPYTGTIILNSQKLESGDDTVIQLLPQPIPLIAGKYSIDVWLDATNTIDGFRCNDTLRYVYNSGGLSLPIDKDFSDPTMPSEYSSSLASYPSYNWGSGGWSQYTTSLSVFGGRVLRFEGTAGDMARLTTQYLDLYQAMGAQLEFWYYHDSNATVHDYTEILVIANGTIIPTGKMLTKKDGNKHGWVKDSLDLSPYTIYRCVQIMFESQYVLSAQYIDRINIYAQQNMALDTILVPSLALCDFKNKTVQVVRRNTAPIVMNFDKDSADIRLEIRRGGNNALISSNSYPVRGQMPGNSIDTFTLTTMNFDTGTITMRAWYVWKNPVVVDKSRSDDTTKRRTISLNPDISIKLGKVTAPGFCTSFGDPITQPFTITNKGDMDVYDIPLILEVWGDTGRVEFLRDTLYGVLQAKRTLSTSFNKKFPAPYEDAYQTYNVEISAELACDIYQYDNVNSIEECVDIADIALTAWISPSPSNTLPDTSGDVVNFRVNLENKSLDRTFTNVVIHADITDGTHAPVTLTETISSISLNGFTPYTFTKPYTIPSGVTSYKVKVYIDSVDRRLINDTLPVRTRTVVARDTDNIVTLGKDGFSLGQNIPNPADNKTRIAYNIPEDGQVIFTVYTVTGQSLYREKQDAYSGENKIEFNTINLANGVYYYSMEYKGERLVKKMTIRR